jgi:hypothetical protein
MFSDLALAGGYGRYARTMRALTSAQLLIRDDWGLDPLDADADRDLYQILGSRTIWRIGLLSNQERSPDPANRIHRHHSRPRSPQAQPGRGDRKTLLKVMR